MAATTSERTTPFAGVVPAKGTFPMAADELILFGTIVCVDADGRAVEGVDGEGLNAAGKAASTFDNRTTAPEGGGAGAIPAEVEYGTHGWKYTGTTPKPGQVVFVVDNQTVSIDSDSNQRGIAGYCTEVRGTACYVWMGPHVTGQIVIAAAVEARVTQNETDIAEIQQTLTSAQAIIPLPIPAWTNSGAPQVAWVNGSDNGLEYTDSKALSHRFGPVGEDTSKLVTSVPLPADLDDSADIKLHILAGRIGTLDTTVVFEGEAFFQQAGAAYDADVDAITVDSAAIDGATKVMKEVTLTISAADVPASPAGLTLGFAPSSALDQDDLIVTATWLEYTRKQLAS